MCIEWDGSPRAVIPLDSLKKCEHPIEATPEMALESEYSFGVGINVIHLGDGTTSKDSWTSDEDDGTTATPLPLFYVSGKAARTRGRDVREGWYAIAAPGEWFEVVVSPLRGIDSVRRTIGKKGNMVTGRLNVEGAWTDDGVMVFDEDDPHEQACKGFTESSELVDHKKTSSVRRFQFVKLKTTNEGAVGKPSPSAGRIRLRLEQATAADPTDGGRKQKREKRDAPTQAEGDGAGRKNRDAPPTVVHEEISQKNGLSVSVMPDGGETIVDETNDIGFKITKRVRLKKEITIYVRERFWLEAQRIIDLTGRAYLPPRRSFAPPPPPAPAHAGDESDEIEEVAVQQKEKPPIELIVISDGEDDLVLPAPEEKPAVGAKRARSPAQGAGDTSKRARTQDDDNLVLPSPEEKPAVGANRARSPAEEAGDTSTRSHTQQDGNLVLPSPEGKSDVGE